jgi:hypothetical protein
MCDWRSSWTKSRADIHSRFTYSGDGTVTVEGIVENAKPETKVIFWAANPPDYRTSYSGSGLPYPNYEMAHESSPSRGVVSVDKQGQFKFSIPYPSGYYSALGTVYIKPHVRFVVSTAEKVSEVQTVKIGEGVPFRLLTYPPIPETAPRCSPQFYAVRDSLPVRTQEQILRDSAYPATNHMPENFWGLTPPH